MLGPNFTWVSRRISTLIWGKEALVNRQGCVLLDSHGFLELTGIKLDWEGFWNIRLYFQGFHLGRKLIIG